jgi:TPR repeat protein
MKSTIAVLLACVSLTATGSSFAGSDMEEAMVFFESGHYLNARDHLRAAARNGDARAAEILGLMLSFGSEMFPGVGRDPQAAVYWFDVAARGGRPVGRYMVCALRKQAGAPAQAARHCFDWVAETGHAGPR